jgi:thiamine pyrophosphokinase
MQGMKRALIILHGNKTDISRIRTTYSSDLLLICADGGAEYARRYHIVPHVVVGDMDSISSETLYWLEEKSVEILKYPRNKDLTDSELAIEKAIEMGCTELIIF